MNVNLTARYIYIAGILCYANSKDYALEAIAWDFSSCRQKSVFLRSTFAGCSLHVFFRFIYTIQKLPNNNSSRTWWVGGIPLGARELSARKKNGDRHAYTHTHDTQALSLQVRRKLHYIHTYAAHTHTQYTKAGTASEKQRVIQSGRKGGASRY